METGSARDQKISLIALLAVCFLLFGLAAAGLFHFSPGSLPDKEIPAAEFSSARAISHLSRIADKPHPVGSAENAQVRAYLIEQLKAMGLAPEVQTSWAIDEAWSVAGVVNNIVVRLPGQTSGKALMVAAHYDSVPDGPGAADDGASVAAALETIRALKLGAPLRNDVIFLFSDAEEEGLLGARAFVSSHPLAKQVGLALNFEYRGNRGPVLMFETSTGNGQLVREFSAATKRPIGNSLMYEIYKIMPHDTDMTVFKAGGIPGLNFAAIEGPQSYHTQLDRPELLDRKTLQHEGELMLSLVRHFGNRPLADLADTDAVYFDFPGLGLVSYSTAWALPLCAVVLAVLIVALARSRKKAGISLPRVLAGSVAFLVTAALLAALCQLAWSVILLLHPDYSLLLMPYQSHWYLIAFVLLTIGAFVLVQSALRKWISPAEFGFGAALCWMLLLLASSVLLPGASFLFAWPLLACLLSWAVIAFKPDLFAAPDKRALLLLGGLAVGILIFSPLIYAVFIGLGPAMIGAVVGVLALLLGLGAPLTGALVRHRPMLAILLLLSSVGFFAAGSVVNGYGPAQPRPDNVFYVQDGATGKAVWTSSDDDGPAGWKKALFAVNAERRPLTEMYGPGVPWQVWTASAQPIQAEPPVAAVMADTVTGGIRVIDLQIKSPRHAPRMLVAVDGVQVLESNLEGRALSTKERENWMMIAYGMPEEGMAVRIKVPAGKPFTVRMVDTTYGLAAAGAPSRPPENIARPYTLSDTVNIVGRTEFK